MKFFSIIAALLVSFCAFAQQPQNEAEMEKQFRESIDKEIERLTGLLELEDWQVFYLDSIITKNSYDRKDEMLKMNEQKMSNTDSYIRIADKYAEATYVAIQKILDDKQWAKYNKTGALKAKKARDKRLEKQQ